MKLSIVQLESDTPWVTERELCELINVSRDTLRRRRKEGKLKPGEHFRATGDRPNSGLQYNVAAVNTEMAKWARTRTRTDLKTSQHHARKSGGAA